MPAPTRRRFINITGFSHTPGSGSVQQFNTIKTIAIDQATAMVVDAADDDKHDSFMAEGFNRTTGSMEISDPVQRQALKALAAGTTTFQGTPEDGGTAYAVTITNCKWHSAKLQASHSEGSKVWAGNMSMSAYAPDGQTDPVTVAAVTEGS